MYLYDSKLSALGSQCRQLLRLRYTYAYYNILYSLIYKMLTQWFYNELGKHVTESKLI